MTFQELNLIPQVLKALEKEGYESPTPIQEEAIPPVLAGRDLLGCAQTGTGKTCAFAVPMLQLLHQSPVSGKKHIRALVLTPTRELALQILESFQAYGRNAGQRSAVMFGGVSQVGQVDALRRGVDILVATPGRLNDLIGQGFVDLSQVEFFVLDEADRMLDMGFIHDVKKIISKLPAKRQTLLFSATMPTEIESLADSILHDPVKVAVTPPATTVEAIDQSVYYVDKDNKRKLLIHLLQDASIVSALVFTRTKHGADRVVRELEHAKISAQAIHGNKSQTARQAALSAFKSGRIRVLVATDIAARGIDIDELSHVINYDIPEVPETYVHRIGRTGRAGLSGIAIFFCDINEKDDFKNVLKLTRREVPVIADHPYPMLITKPVPKSQLRAHNREPREPKQGNAPAWATPPIGQGQPKQDRRGNQRMQPKPQENQNGQRQGKSQTRQRSAGEFGEVQNSRNAQSQRPPKGQEPSRDNRQGKQAPQQAAKPVPQPAKPVSQVAEAVHKAVSETKPADRAQRRHEPEVRQPLPKAEYKRTASPAFQTIDSLRKKPTDQPLSDHSYTRRG